MGTSQAYDYKTGRWVYDCSSCGTVGGVRRRNCPANYCPKVQLCSDCYKKLKAEGVWKDWHKDCQRHSDNYRAEQAKKEAQPEQYAKAAWGKWHTGTDDVLVLTWAGNYVLVPSNLYDADCPLSEQQPVEWTAASGVELPYASSKEVC